MRGGDQRPFGTFVKIHLFWRCRASLTPPLLVSHIVHSKEYSFLERKKIKMYLEFYDFPKMDLDSQSLGEIYTFSKFTIISLAAIKD